MGAFIELDTPDEGKKWVNPNLVAEIAEITPVNPDTQPSARTVLLTYTGGVKKRSVKGTARQIAGELSRGLR